MFVVCLYQLTALEMISLFLTRCCFSHRQTQFPEIVVEQSDDEGSDEEHPAGEGVGPAADRRGAAAGERGPETEALRGEGDVD